jgi:hypothetical protein
VGFGISTAECCQASGLQELDVMSFGWVVLGVLKEWQEQVTQQCI